MSHGTVRRWKAVEAFKGKPVQAAYGFDIVPMETEFYMASDYDALRTQARELADAAKLFAEGWGYAGKQQAEAMDLIQKAQSVLDATKEGA